MNEILLITQVIEKNGRSYLLQMPYGCPFDDLFAVLQEFQQSNIDKQKQLKEQAEEQKLKEEMANAHAEASNEK